MGRRATRHPEARRLVLLVSFGSLSGARETGSTPKCVFFVLAATNSEHVQVVPWVGRGGRGGSA